MWFRFVSVILLSHVQAHLLTRVSGEECPAQQRPTYRQHRIKRQRKDTVSVTQSVVVLFLLICSLCHID